MTVRGSCLCGDVGYEMTADPVAIFHCHCSRCRKARGTAHATNLIVALDGFRYVRGEELLTEFKPKDAARFKHVFCRACGASMPNTDPARGFVIIPMGSFDDAPAPCGVQHIHVGSKAAWDVITDDLPQHENGPVR